MTAPTNTFTITFADAHSNSVQYPGMPGDANATMGGKADALRNLCNQPGIVDGQSLAALTSTDTLTITITQP